MKHKAPTGFFVIAIILVLFALFFLLHSQFIGKMASFRIHYELQQIQDPKHHGKSFTLSYEKVRELVKLASQDEIRWRRTTGSAVKISFYTAIFLFLLGSIQIAIYYYIYKRDIALPPETAGAN
jgi:hypothetical protein